MSAFPCQLPRIFGSPPTLRYGQPISAPPHRIPNSRTHCSTTLELSCRECLRYRSLGLVRSEVLFWCMASSRSNGRLRNVGNLFNCSASPHLQCCHLTWHRNRRSCLVASRTVWSTLTRTPRQTPAGLYGSARRAYCDRPTSGSLHSSNRPQHRLGRSFVRRKGASTWRRWWAMFWMARRVVLRSRVRRRKPRIHWRCLSGRDTLWCARQRH